MANVPLSTRFIGISENVNLTERKSAVLNADTQPYTIADLVSTIGTGAQGPQGVQGPAGPIGPVGPAGLTWRGAWVSGTSYVANDAVAYNGASWFCILATSGTTTPNLATANWALLASQGAQGIQGAQGPTGPQGAGSTQTLQQTIQLGSTVSNSSQTVQIIPQFINIKKNDDSTFVSLFPSNVSFGKTSGAIALQCPSSIVGGNKTITLPDASGTVALQNYKSYVAKITHGAGNAAPTAVVLENTIGTVTWQYEEEFNYALFSAGLFTVGKTVVFATSPVFPLMKVGVSNNNANFVGLTTDNDGFANLMLEIRVYN